MQKPWEGRFREKTDELVEEFTQSVSFDRRLALQDIRQNLAHLKALRTAGIVSEEEEKLLRKGLEEIEQEVRGKQNGIFQSLGRCAYEHRKEANRKGGGGRWQNPHRKVPQRPGSNGRETIYKRRTTEDIGRLEGAKKNFGAFGR
jgi:argininosuccinate lyase (EC 4.3.2.1)